MLFSFSYVLTELADFFLEVFEHAFELAGNFLQLTKAALIRILLHGVSFVKKQIPPDLVVKSQAIDIAEVI
jgi:hypothetical protein